MDSDAMSPFLKDKCDGFCREKIDPAIVVMRISLFHVKMVKLRKPLIDSTTQTAKAQNVSWPTTSREDIFPQKLYAFRQVR